jgi:hypothetical protein
MDAAVRRPNSGSGSQGARPVDAVEAEPEVEAGPAVGLAPWLAAAATPSALTAALSCGG